MEQIDNSAGPATPADRFIEIDALRGLALFGILLANLPSFIGLAMADTPERAMAIIGDMPQVATGIIVNFILDGKFYTVFSLLFGLGFSLQLDRLTRRGAAGTSIFMRRMAILLMIGLIHLSFIWSGDILTLYALAGFTLSLFHRMKDVWLLSCAFFLVLIVPFVGLFLLPTADGEWTAPVFALGDTLFASTGHDADASYFVILKDQWWPTVWARAASEWAYVAGDKLYTWRIPKVLGTMLLGMWAGRMLVRGRLIGNTRLLWSVAIAGAVIAVPTNLVYMQQPPHTQTHWSSLAGTLPAGLAYAALFLLAAPYIPRVIDWLAGAGRMALTNYLATSVICVLIFQGAGLGLMGSVTLFEAWLFGCALFAAMLVWSRWWLGGREQGPMEALWRRLTYPTTPPA